MAAGGALGLLLSIALFLAGIMPQSFPDGEPALEIDEELYQAEVALAKRENLPVPARPRVYSRPEIRTEIGKEIVFLLPPLLGALALGSAVFYSGALRGHFSQLMQYDWLSGLLGAAMGAMTGALMVWVAQILGTLAFGAWRWAWAMYT